MGMRPIAKRAARRVSSGSVTLLLGALACPGCIDPLVEDPGTHQVNGSGSVGMIPVPTAGAPGGVPGAGTSTGEPAIIPATPTASADTPATTTPAGAAIPPGDGVQTTDPTGAAPDIEPTDPAAVQPPAASFADAGSMGADAGADGGRLVTQAGLADGAGSDAGDAGQPSNGGADASSVPF